MEKTKVIRLSTPIEDNAQKIIYEEIHLREPALFDVEQFYEMDRKSNPLAAMRLLIALVSPVPETVLKKMAITDFRECEAFLTDFLAYTPSNNGSDSRRK
ncbi:phage tail assembly protein [Xenorhabdus bovienii]|nr:phage tail assembly protein [Xenorhabdus bovienii]MDE1494894.1 phage tail assembly protein [Xenorhabdus bovienii]MDE9473489.1 phage tail assembly protein [Xenorhabdus bovienii]MDE9495869.1 phage tail assembly protein [Xenorhabdus bovienii]MDE9504263.1 phage tail assembly protein [Xenorhabdus bovienii]